MKPLALAVLPALVSALLPFTAPAQVMAPRYTSGVSRPMVASEAAGLQQFLGSPAGAPLLAANPGLQTVLGLDVSNQAHLQALGPLSARLPHDFAARAVSDAGAARTVLSGAYNMSAGYALGEIDALTREAVKSAATGQNAWRGLGAAASDLKAYSLYGQAARERVTIFAQKVAAVRSEELAEKLARELLAGPRSPEAALGGIVAFNSEGKKMPASGKLKPYDKTVEFNGQTFPSVAFPLAQDKSEPKRGLVRRGWDWLRSF